MTINALSAAPRPLPHPLTRPTAHPLKRIKNTHHALHPKDLSLNEAGLRSGGNANVLQLIVLLQVLIALRLLSISKSEQLHHS